MSASDAGETARSGRATLFWAVLGIAGYAASLAVVAAGHAVRYAHYLPLAEWLVRRPIATGFLAFEAAAVVTGFWRTRPGVLAWLRNNLNGWGVAVVVLVFALTSAAVSKQPAGFAVELVAATVIQAVHLGALVLAVRALPANLAASLGGRWNRWLEPSEAGLGRDRFVISLALFAAVVPALLAVFAYELHPHVPDELVYLIHARYFAAGRLWLPAPEPAAAFDVDLMFRVGDRWFCPVPPGWPLMLAVGVRLGIPWLVNPLLNGINTLLAHVVLRDLYDRRTARLGTLLFALSPWNLYLAMSLLTHTFSLTCALVAAYGVIRWRRGGTPAWLAIGGVGIGLVSLIRPLEGMVVAAVLGLAALLLRPWHRGFLGAAGLGLATALVAATTLPYNKLFTGSATKFPIMAYNDALYGPGSNDMGFGPNRGLGWSGLDPFPGHGLRDVIVNNNLNLSALNVELLGWGIGSLLVVALGVLLGRRTRSDWVMIGAIAAVIGVHALYWFAGGPDFGPRYWYLVVLPALALASRGLLKLTDANPPRSAGQTGLAVLVLMTGTLLVFIPWRAVDKYHHYRGMRPDVRQIADSAGFGRSLVLVRGRRHPDYASAVAYNPLDLNADQPIYAWDRDSTTRAAVLARYPNRQIWVLDGPTLTGSGYRIAAGPLPPGTAVPEPSSPK